MAVLLTVSETLTGSAFGDALEGGGTGIDYGNVVTGQYAPIINQATNEGHLDIYVRHDATIDPITSLKVFVQQYGTGTGFTYGGADSAAGDYSKLLNMGNASSGANANNADGLSGGLHFDMDWQVSTATQFNPARIGSNVKVFGDNGGAATGEGRNLASAFDAHVDAMSWNNSTVETDASSPVTGTVGKSGDSVLGDNFHTKARFFLRSDETEGGVLQFETVFSYSYTA